MITTVKSGIARLINGCVSNGMTHVVCSPGSRNAALIIAIDNHPSLTSIVIHDERSAGFYAIGMSQQLKSPVGLVCTSGSAMLNYFPAVAEAFYQCVPIVVMSADRPQEWVNHGDGQTIMQVGAYGKHICFEAEVSEIVSESEYGEFDEKINTGFKEGNGAWKGPIHFNCPISEPMYGTVEVKLDALETIASSEVPNALTVGVLSELKTIWESSKRKLILCGQMEKDAFLQSKLSSLAIDNSVIVVVENTSNLIDQKFIHCIDRTLAAFPEEEIEDFKPDLLITIGGAIISKRIKNLLRQSDIKSHWKIGFEFPEMNTFRKLSRSIECNPSDLFKSILDWNSPMHVSSFGLKWKKIDYLNKDLLPSFFQTANYSDLSVFELLLDYLPDNSLLHMGNSSVVRYCQLVDPVSTIQYYSNRGTSGIDGSTSTACGAAFIKNNKLNILISGDVSFFYDSNALWSNYLGGNLRIVVINNAGGGIFRIIDGPSKVDQLEEFFETKQNFSAEKICEAFNVDYQKASNLSELEQLMPEFMVETESDRPILLEIFTPNTDNDVELKRFFEHFKSNN
ncbi:MAG: 2-succinyl-5-enolpyruvyl-6-hydroxy-3-cyclohexene-1-carboxylic-acid synthase [Crocinitomicaceae bacterium]|nr:2-succinyl-5-enolpyruvyl-6-hydroxy-3-cyclohexene-1-carboxylic-acid synthase [Crocinitomicaceae bacterium]MDC0098911.1 2-succinyl-5-enolpyruvyl-6-hydroxy-3-cyclohexene-1-carboxylic-acid synthase [Crocinitomicaceae bacterium]